MLVVVGARLEPNPRGADEGAISTRGAKELTHNPTNLPGSPRNTFLHAQPPIHPDCHVVYLMFHGMVLGGLPTHVATLLCLLIAALIMLCLLGVHVGFQSKARWLSRRSHARMVLRQRVLLLGC